jgi:murein DD-endopeptidase MepM/ murein hydrolase activator NlpD
MPRIKVLIILAALAARSLLALPAGASYYPEAPEGTWAGGGFVGGSPTLAGALRSTDRLVAASAEAPASRANVSPGILTALPHKAISGRILPETSLTSLQLSLERPFTDTLRQSPEFTYPYGSRGDGRYVLHTGVDIGNPMGTPVQAVADGMVVFAGSDSEQVFGPRPNYYGNLVVMQPDGAPEAEPVYVLFGHLDTVLVASGERVTAGQVVGLVGMTGIAIGPHLHMEVRQGENSYEATRNPELWLRSLPGRGTLAGRIVDEAGRPVANERLLLYSAERPNQVWRVVRSYLDSPLIHADDVASENFALLDVPAGEYRIVAGRAGASTSIPVRIDPGRLTMLEIVVEDSP